MRLLSKTLLGLFLVGCTWNVSHAEIIPTDQITSDVFFGNGNSNGNFTVSQKAGVEIGLRAKVRYPSPLDDDQSNLLGYDIDQGVYYIAEPAVAPRLDRASWNVDWSVNSDYAETTNNMLSNFTYNLSVVYDPLSTGGTAGIAGYDPLQAGNDNSYGDNTTDENSDVMIGSGGTITDIHNTYTVAQNSTNITFSEIGLSNLYGGLYTFVFTVSDTNGVVASDQIEVYVGVNPPAAVPEPTSMAILGMGVLGFVGGGVARRRLKQKKEASNS
ncbi:PEP-CTERM sorting domain-containing protein [Blastopirellula marina]|uniref:Ice-binding protein C-terminal domain-containing protein n=1 Tax=Blastopirellula marina TaxID=124 RepID=A0A2S8FXN8_9BACT|nr:PEP-CTERM sorting domain-containing protein [Blastopirellula marina]PQO36604.1 hypothetical protein C5Y98_11450 [Blastopirellula marina]PTL44434.1 PEP-CTERM sorting domain-containing protein [Blastopirellula marina]